ncbi:MAG: hypothetical protein AABY42_02435 [Nitrospirota bacterium]
MARRFGPESKNDLFYLEEEELDAMKTLLAYLLMENTPLDKDDIYTYIFGEGKKILWQ